MMKTNHTMITMLIVASLILITLSGCQRVVPTRTLPAWVQGVYIPMVQNKSYEPALEENATILLQEAFLSDGRLRVVPEKDADMTVVAEILDWQDVSSGTSGDKITDSETIYLTARLKLYEPYDMEEPLADLGEIFIMGGAKTDTRSVDFVSEPDRKTRTLKQFASIVVSKTITGFPTELRQQPGGLQLPTPTSADEINPPEVFRPKSSRMEVE